MKYFVFVLCCFPFLVNANPFSLLPQKPSSEVTKTQTDTSQFESEKKIKKVKSLKVSRVSDLAELSSFSDIATIQKRFLPKTFRFELSLAPVTNLNNPFFIYLGGRMSLAFYFLEEHGIEFEGVNIHSWLRPLTRALGEIPNKIAVATTSPTVKAFVGAYYKWSPIYGKFSLSNVSIVPFDMFFVLGGGLTLTGLEKSQDSKELSNQDKWYPTFAFGVGQTFASSKSFALYWDLKWLTYKTDVHFPIDLIFSLGVSFYFPGATYR